MMVMRDARCRRMGIMRLWERNDEDETKTNFGNQVHSNWGYFGMSWDDGVKRTLEAMGMEKTTMRQRLNVNLFITLDIFFG